MKKEFFNKEDFTSWERRYRANFFNSLGGYKSLNLIATSNQEGMTNLAPFFSVQHIGANPPLLSLIFRPHTVERHSLENFRETSFASINSVHTEILDAAHQTSAKYDREVSEFEAVGLTPSFLEFPAPFVKESHLSIGIKLEQENPIPLNDTILVIASIEEVHINSKAAILKDGLIDHSILGNLCVNGLDSYYKPERLKRLAYAQPDQTLKEIDW